MWPGFFFDEFFSDGSRAAWVFFFFFSFVFFSDVSFYNGYKSSLRDSIFMQLPRGKNATSDMIRPWK